MKKFLTILPLLVTVGFLTAGIIWLGISFNQDQKQTFHVIESGRTEIKPEETDSCTSDESVCMASTTPLSTTQ